MTVEGYDHVIPEAESSAWMAAVAGEPSTLVPIYAQGETDLLCPPVVVNFDTDDAEVQGG